ncbi:Frizzled-8, partial [Cichlidogyrus casuarinus]
LQQWIALAETRCSRDIHFFLCAVYVPICVSNYDEPLPPCRPVCERAKNGCKRVLETHGFPWPASLECTSFPKEDGDQLCMDRENEYENPNTHKHIYGKRVGQKHRLRNQEAYLFTSNNKSVQPHSVRVLQAQPGSRVIPQIQYSGCECPCAHPFIKVSNQLHPQYSETTVAGLPGCLQPCRSALLFYVQEEEMGTNSSTLVSLDQDPATSMEAVNFQRLFIFWYVLAVLSLVANFTRLLIHSMKEKRTFCFESRPKEVLGERELSLNHSRAHFMILLGFALRLYYGHDKVSCQMHNGLVNSHALYLEQAQAIYPLKWRPLCVTSFLLTYCGTLASYTWWLISLLQLTARDQEFWTFSNHNAYSKVSLPQTVFSIFTEIAHE